MKELTKAEEEVMQILWKLEKGFVKDVLDKMDEPKPSYTTVSTVIRVLEKKKFVGHKVYGNTHEYYPLISKESYKEFLTNKVVDNYFGGSVKSLLSFFAKKEKIDLKELDDIMKVIENNKK